MHTSYKVVDSSTLAIKSGLTLFDLTGTWDGKNLVRVDNMTLKTNYSIKIRSNVIDGGNEDYYYSSTFIIKVDCTNTSTNITDQPPH